MRSEKFTGHSGEMREDSPWLASEDIDVGNDVECTIKALHCSYDVAFEGGRIKKKVFSIEFVGKKRQLVLNTINRKRIRSMYGSKTSEWLGKKVKLYVDHKVMLKGELVSGIRVRSPNKEKENHVK